MRTITVLSLLFFTVSAEAQTILSGKITDINNQPLPLANVSLKGTYDGATTDIDGNFQFTTMELGVETLTVSYTGFKPSQHEITLAGQALSFAIQLEEDIQSIKVVTITAGSFTAGDASTKNIFRAVDIATTAGATADIAAAMNTLPGTQKVGESGRLFVRGGDGKETGTFIDGLAVPGAYSPSAPNTPSRGRFLPFMFNGMSFSTGGYSTEYGQALSSVLILDSRDKVPITRTDFGILSVGADIGHTQVWKNGSASAKVQHTDLRPYFSLIDQRIDWIKAPVADEIHAVLRQQSGRHGLLKVYGNYSDNNLSLYNHDIDDRTVSPFELTSQYQYLNGSYKNHLNSNWLVRGGVAYARAQTTTVSISTAEEDERTAHAKVVFEGSLSESIELKTGAETVARHFSGESENGQSFAQGETITSIFGEADQHIGRRFISRAGLRTEYNSLNHRLTTHPRMSLAYKTGEQSQISLALGQFTQSPESRFLRSNRNLRPERATHYIFNYQRIEGNRTLRFETFHKQYTNLVRFDRGKIRHVDNSGYGYARGFELFWRDNQTFKSSDYWISYSFLDTKRNYLDFPVEATPSFASKHNFSIVIKHFIKRLKSQGGATFSYTSGRRYHDRNALTFNTGNTPSYQDLSVNWSYLPTPSLIIYFSCTNLIGRENIFGYEYSRDTDEHGLYVSRPIRQPATRFLFLAIFITISKEKSVNQLPNL